MNARQHLNDIALTLGLPALDFDANGCARMLFDGKVAVNFESDELSGQLHLYCDLGELPLSGREAVYRSLLTANLFGVQTQGSTLAVDPSQDQVVLSRSVLVEGLSLNSFAHLLDGFIGCAEHWQQFMASGPAHAASNDAEPGAADQRPGGGPAYMQV